MAATGEKPMAVDTRAGRQRAPKRKRAGTQIATTARESGCA
jgi:hypothetical protein